MAQQTPPKPIPTIPVQSPGGTMTTAIPDLSTPSPVSQGPSKSPISLRAPLKYNFPSSSSFEAPSLDWLQRTWTVTHSTLPMWRKAKNVRITYKIIEPTTADGVRLLDDTVESEPTQKTLLPQPKAIKGVDTPVGKAGEPDQGWNWRGRGWLKIASSHWEVLGWGERGGEKWVVTWFAASMFTPPGLDIYCDRKEGMSKELLDDIMIALEDSEAKDMAELCRKDMKAIVNDSAT